MHLLLLLGTSLAILLFFSEYPSRYPTSGSTNILFRGTQSPNSLSDVTLKNHSTLKQAYLLPQQLPDSHSTPRKKYCIPRWKGLYIEASEEHYQHLVHNMNQKINAAVCSADANIRSFMVHPPYTFSKFRCFRLLERFHFKCLIPILEERPSKFVQNIRKSNLNFVTIFFSDQQHSHGHSFSNITEYSLDSTKKECEKEEEICCSSTGCLSPNDDPLQWQRFLCSEHFVRYCKDFFAGGRAIFYREISSNTIGDNIEEISSTAQSSKDNLSNGNQNLNWDLNCIQNGLSITYVTNCWELRDRLVALFNVKAVYLFDINGKQFAERVLEYRQIFEPLRKMNSITLSVFISDIFLVFNDMLYIPYTCSIEKLFQILNQQHVERSLHEQVKRTLNLQDLQVSNQLALGDIKECLEVLLSIEDSDFRAAIQRQRPKFRVVPRSEFLDATGDEWPILMPSDMRSCELYDIVGYCN